MGIQVIAKEKDLRKAGFMISFDEELVVDWQDEVFASEELTCHLVGVRRLVAKSPSGVVMRSYVEGCLMFDNKNVNHRWRQELEKHGVPYTRG